MADERLGGSFSIDITNLKAGLNEANRLIRESEAQFRASASGMDDWSNSEAGLIERQKSLNTQIDIQKQKIAALVTEKQKVIDKMTEEGKSQEKIDKAIDGTNKQITKESKELDKLKSELEKTDTALDDMNDSQKDVEQQSEKTSGSFTVMKGALANLVADGFHKAIDAAKNFARSMLDTAAEVQAANSQFEQTFGDLEDEATEAISGIAKETGILETRLRSTGAGIYAFARSSGASTSEAMALMQDALLATADSAAYYDRSLEDSAETLQSFLKGNFENDAALGLSATEFTRNAKAAELFGVKYNDLTEIQKQQTLLRMVTDSQKVAGAFGQAAREADGWENVQGNLNETWKQFQARVGSPVLKNLIPVIQNATKEFDKFSKTVDWDKFGKKVTTTMQNMIDTAKTLGKSALPVASAALKVAGGLISFVAENFKTLAAVTLTAVTAFKAFSAVMAVTTAVTAAKTAIAGLEAGIGLATKAQAIWNATMAANPIGAVITAVALLTGGIALLVTANKDAEDTTKLLNEEQLNAVNRAKEVADAYAEQKKAAEELASAEIANIDYTNRLWKELENLTDENGNVKEGYEGRAKFILNELNTALGTEYTMNGNVIQSYKDIQSSIEKVIEAKKAQILLEAYEDSYRAAIEGVTQAEKERAENAQLMAEQEAVYQEALKELREVELEYSEKTAQARTDSDYRKLASDATRLQKMKENADKEKEKLDEVAGAYDLSEQNLYGYYRDINGYETASTLVMQGETDKAISYLNNLGSGFKTAASTAKLSADEQKKTLEQQVIDTEVNAQLMKEAYESGVEGVTEEMVKTAQTQADTAKEEFLKVGGNITKGIAKGAEDEDTVNWTLSGAMKRLINRAVAAARKAADEHSPSKLFEKKVGIGLPQGVAVGVDKGTKTVVKSVKKQIGEIRKAYDLSGISSDVDVGINSSFVNQNNNGTNKKNGSVIVNQVNNYSQAHSRLELFKTKQQTEAAVRLAIGTV